MPRFGKDKDKDNRREELDRQAAEEVERLTRRGAAPSGMGGRGGMPGQGGPPQMGIPSPLEMMAERVREQPRPSQRPAGPSPRRAAPPAQTFTPLPTGSVGSSFGPAGLSPGPRGGVSAPPPSAFGGGGFDEDFGGAVTGPPVYNAGEPDEEEEMSITEIALMDHAAKTGHNPEDLVIQYDASSAEEMRDSAMRAFYERQQSRRPSTAGNNPFAPAGMRAGPPGAAPARRVEDPAAAGGALAQRLAARRRREEEEARRARGEPEPGSVASSAGAGTSADEDALGRVLARRRRSLGLAETEDQTPEPTPVPGRRHAQRRVDEEPGVRGASLAAIPDAIPTLDDMATTLPSPSLQAPRRTKPAAAKKSQTAKAAGRPAPAPPTRKTARATKAAAPSDAGKRGAMKPKAAPAIPTKAPAKTTAAATRRPGPAKVASPAKAGSPATKVKVKAVFCIDCGEKNPAVAKFCFACGVRLTAPEG